MNPRILFFLVLLSGALFFSACQEALEDDTNPKPEVESSPTALDAERQFFYAWLADCVNDIALKHRTHTTDSLLTLANQRITNALADSNIYNVLGRDTLVWGPQLSVDDQGDDYYTSTNMIYCVRRTDTTGTRHYSIGIAGTNMISPYDWLTEDLEVDSMVSWQAGGKIAFGTHKAFENINGFKDSSKSLVEYLLDEHGQNSNMKITVAGHSLGGALTQVYSSYIKHSFNRKNPNVKAFVYAGPSAGNQEFADSLIKSLNGYYAYNNQRDVIPHAWQADSLKQLCDIYDGIILCKDTIQDNPAMDGTIKYLREITRHGDFAFPAGEKVIFPGEVITIPDSTCTYLTGKLGDLWDSGVEPYGYLNSIASKCNGGTQITYDQFLKTFFYLGEMGAQHTSGYFNHFFGQESQQFQTAVDNYVPGQHGDAVYSNLIEGRDILDRYLKKVDNYLHYYGISDCSCND
jgi:hypothetical protein